MRRRDKELTDKSQMEEIINSCLVCRLAMVDGNKPYIIPVSFAYKDGSIYIHCATVGRKIDILKANNNVCIEFDIMVDYITSVIPCQGNMKYRSVLAYGKAQFINNPQRKKEALNLITEHYSGITFDFTDDMVNTVCIIQIIIEEMTGKVSGEKG